MRFQRRLQEAWPSFAPGQAHRLGAGTSWPWSSRSGTLRLMDKVTEAVVDTVKQAAAKVVGADKPLPLPETREQLLALHDVARHKRDAAPRDSHERVEASYEIER